MNQAMALFQHGIPLQKNFRSDFIKRDSGRFQEVPLTSHVIVFKLQSIQTDNIFAFFSRVSEVPFQPFPF